MAIAAAPCSVETAPGRRWSSQLRPIERVSLLRCSVLVVHGTDDRHTTIQEAERLFAAVPRPGSSILYPGRRTVICLSARCPGNGIGVEEEDVTGPHTESLSLWIAANYGSEAEGQAFESRQSCSVAPLACVTFNLRPWLRKPRHQRAHRRNVSP